MAHGTRIRPNLAAWNATPAVTGAEMDHADGAQFRAIDGDAGGVWAPVAEIEIGGAGCRVSGNFNASNAQDVTVKGVLLVDTGGTCQVATGGNLTCTSGSTTTWQSGAIANVALGAELDINGLLKVKSGGQITCLSGAGITTLAGCTTTFGGTVLLENTVTKIGAARTIPRSSTTTNADVSVGVGTNDVHLFQANAGGGYTVTLLIATAPAPSIGEEILFQKGGTGAVSVTYKNEGSAGNLIAYLGADRGQFRAVFDGTKWRLAGAAFNGTPGADAAP